MRRFDLDQITTLPASVAVALTVVNIAAALAGVYAMRKVARRSPDTAARMAADYIAARLAGGSEDGGCGLRRVS